MKEKIFQLKGNKSFNTIIRFSSGNLVVSIIGAISLILYGRWVNPETLGEFRQYGIFTGYIGFCLIFLDAGFRRSFFLESGKSNHEGAKKMAQVAHYGYLILTLLGFITFTVLVIYSFLQNDYRAAFGWLAQTTVFGITVYGAFFNTLYKSNSEFSKLNKNNIQAALISLLLLPLVYYLHYYGLAVRQFITKGSQLLLLRNRAPIKVKPRRDFKSLMSISRVSIPLQFPAILESAVLKPSINLFILSFFTKEGLGIFSYALLMQSFFLTLATSVNQVLIAKFNLFYGKNGNFMASIKYMYKPIILAGTFGFCIAVIVCLVVPSVIDFILPKYSYSGLILSILAFQVFFRFLSSPLSILTMALMYKTRLILVIIKTVVTVIFLYLFPKELRYIALALVLSEAVNVLIGYLLIALRAKKELSSVR